MSANADVKISVKLADSASAGLLKSLGLIDAETGKVSAQAAKAGGALDAMGKKLGSGSGALKGTSRELDTMASKAKRVGDNLKSGLTTALSRAKEISSTLGRAGMATAGAGTAAYMGLKTQMPYDRGLSLNAQVMFGAKDDGGRTYTRDEANAQKQRLGAQIDNSVAGGVATKDEAMAAQNEILALAGAKFKGEEGLKRLDTLLPQILKAGAVSGTDPRAMAGMAAAFANKGYKDSEIVAALGKGIVSDNSGGFKLSAMANWMPKWLAGAGDALKGEHAANALFKHAQSVRKNSGSDDEAGVNMENIINYAVSDKADKSLKKTYGVDRKTEVEKNMSKGDDYLTATARMVKGVVEKDAHFRDLQNKARNAGSEADKGRIYGEMAAYTAQGIIGDNYMDVQARKALLAIITDLDNADAKKMGEDISSEKGQIITDAFGQRVEGDATSSDVQMRNAAATGVNAALQELTPNIKAASDAFAAFASANPKTTGAGVIGMSAAAVGSGLFLGLPKLLGGIFGGDKVDKVSKKSAKTKGAAIDVPEPHAPSTNKGAGKPSRVGRGVKVGGALALASLVAEPALGMVAGEGSAVQRYGSAAINGAATGAFLGSLVPVVGTAVGAAAGGAIGMALEYFKPHPDAGAAQPVSNQMPVQPAAQISAPQSEQLVIANAQLQQVNQQIAQLNQVANNEKLLTPLGQIQSGIAALNGKPWSFTASIPVYVDGNMVTQTVNKINGNQFSRGG